MTNKAIVFCGLTDLDDFALSDEDERVYRKEVIYERDNFRTDDFRFDVAESDLHHWKGQFDKMTAAGIDVPAPLEHTTAPDQQRATVVGMDVAVNSRGQNALFASFKFGNKEDEKLAKRGANVSIFQPKSFEVDGKVFKNAIRHIAFTSYPAVPRLDGFEVIAASLSGEKPMTLEKVAESLGITSDEGADDDALTAAIVSKFEDLSEKVAKLEAEAKKSAEESAGEGEGEGGETTPAETVAVAASLLKHPTVVLDQVKENRELKLSALVGTGKISPACAKALLKEWCSDEALALSLSSDSHASQFKALLTSLDLNEEKKIGGERTTHQALSLSGGSQSGGPNPLTDDMDRRAEAAKARRA